MRVLKRSGTLVPMKFDAVSTRIRNLMSGLSPTVDATKVAQKVFSSMRDEISTQEIDSLTAEISIGMSTEDTDYEVLAARLEASNIQKKCPDTFWGCARKLYAAELISDEMYHVVTQHRHELAVVPERDFDIGYFGLKTLEKGYLLGGLETPQYMFMRVAIGVHGNDVPRILETYELLSRGFCVHATPTLFNAGTTCPQMSSCFLLATKDDSIEGIYDTLKRCAHISKWAGGIGLHISNVRANKSPIRGTHGVSDGIVPMLRVFNATARYVNQAGKRKGSIAVYLEPWHADVLEFLELRLNQGDEEARTRDLFTALWIPDLFMRRVKDGGQWSLMCPLRAPGLADVHGEAFDELYTRYEAEGRATKTIPAQEIWSAILKSQTETGTPYMLYKDACNAKSNQKNLGTIKSSNLCVAPETKILTRQGHRIISTIGDGGECEVWNGFEWSTVVVRRTNPSSELVQVSFSDGNILECTPYHKFYVQVVTLTEPEPEPVVAVERSVEPVEGASEPVVEPEPVPPPEPIRTVTVIMKTASELVRDDVILDWSEESGVLHESVRVTGVSNFGRVDSTWCFTEPLRNMGVFNGVLAGNCTEIIEYTDPDEVAVCNLGSLALPAFVEGAVFDYEALHRATRVLTRNLNRVIDRNYYPIPEAHKSNMRHRPIGLGVQGLADAFLLCGHAFDSREAARMNIAIFETMYHAALTESCELARLEGPYETFKGSPASEGILQFDMWEAPKFSGLYKDWDTLKGNIRVWGLRNSLLMAPMPTASTSQILGNNECIEPYTTNMYLRRTLAGEFVVVNRHLVTKLKQLGLWSKETKDRIVRNGGSVQGLTEIPKALRDLFKTVWEIKQKVIIDMARDRGCFIDQSQSMNLFMEEPTAAKLSSMHMYAWEQGLKTGMYYLRTKAKAKPIQFSLEPDCKMCSA
jgi:ribonucleotide reductase alpha subunit